MKQTPYQTNVGSPITSHVSSLELQGPTGDILPIQNLSSPITVYLNNTVNNIDTINGIIESYSHDITFYKLNISEPNITIILDVKCSSSCTVFWQKRPSTFGYNWNITTEDSFKTFLRWNDGLNGTGDYYLGISHNNLTNQSCYSSGHMVYNISVHIVSCVYWDEIHQQWNTYGCKVRWSSNVM